MKAGDRRKNIVLMEPTAQALRDEFIGWQCRLRQLSVREGLGRPSSGMRPRVSTLDGAELAPAVTLLLMREDPAESTQEFRFQVQKTQDPVERYDKALEILSAWYYQRPRDFTDVMTGLFGPGSALVDRLLLQGRCELEFVEYARGYRIPCSVLELAETDAHYQATYWHNRLFNANMPAGVRVLSFTPDWTHSADFDVDPDGE
ncbi:MAG TPA: hypothetical protein VHA10_04305 [Hypericibacter adhaerens]|jgi:hypothetical protein|uniref:Uncharacterized protein n=1 Tax=Hypericibacter adhaerens TaxID=2602016 RepID=A0A5J6MWE1_9PROT|nr:hypothetical protein [Hypericibacter adhaerens]QEX21789.1 hypothetical protein FRZ61_17180 [Hypericibacter adhaerens]HWA42409.1 hypothetical protein [Hypericibacter adhaerens]